MINGMTSVDLCNSMGLIMNTESMFDQVTGSYMFYSTNKLEIPPGDYDFQVTGAIGRIDELTGQIVSERGDPSKTTTFTMTIVDPCNHKDLMKLKPSPFIDQSFTIGAIQSSP